MKNLILILLLFVLKPTQAQNVTCKMMTSFDYSDSLYCTVDSLFQIISQKYKNETEPFILSGDYKGSTIYSMNFINSTTVDGDLMSYSFDGGSIISFNLSFFHGVYEFIEPYNPETGTYYAQDKNMISQLLLNLASFKKL